MKRYLLWILIFSLACLSTASSSLAQTYEDDVDALVEPEHYRESALRRFEIIFQVSLPFTALHSYGVVRVVEMIRQDKVAPKFSRTDWITVGTLAILYSGFIGLWDYLHTRGEDIRDMSVPRGETGLSTSLHTDYRYNAAPREPMLGLVSMGF
jgi:hypothetical protein